jgi:dinuclear metal center YbgI/SA1388 family protein
MATVREVMEAMERWAPSSLAESWDNPGLMTGDPDASVRTALITLDVTEESLDVAAGADASMIISHHPPIFKPLPSLAGDSLSARVIRKALRLGISVYSSHTNLDQAPGGVSHAAAEKLGLRVLSPLVRSVSPMAKFVTFCPPGSTDGIRDAASMAGAGVIGAYRSCSFTSHGTGTYIPSDDSRPFEGKPGAMSRAEEDRIEMIVPAVLARQVVDAVRKVHPYEEMACDVIPLVGTESPFGYGVVGELQETVDADSFLRHVARALDVEALTVSGGAGRAIRRVAVMGGSGGRYIGDAAAAGVDAFITGDLGYHDFLEGDDSLLLIDASHRATELPVLRAIARILEHSFSSKIDFVVHDGSSVPVTTSFTIHSPCEGGLEGRHER